MFWNVEWFASVCQWRGQVGITEEKVKKRKLYELENKTVLLIYEKVLRGGPVAEILRGKQSEIILPK